MMGFINQKLLEEARETDVEKSNLYTVITVRPGDKNAAMLNVFTRIYGKFPSAIISDGISGALLEFLLSDERHFAVLREYLENDREAFDDKSVIARLIHSGVICVMPSVDFGDFTE